jgi:hypothetical protein
MRVGGTYQVIPGMWLLNCRERPESWVVVSDRGDEIAMQVWNGELHIINFLQGKE